MAKAAATVGEAHDGRMTLRCWDWAFARDVGATSRHAAYRGGQPRTLGGGTRREGPL